MEYRRLLASHESSWLLRSETAPLSPLCMLATLAPDIGLTESVLESALKYARAKHPYLGARVDGTTDELVVDASPSCSTRLTQERAENSGGSVDIRTVVRRELLSGLNPMEGVMARVHLAIAPEATYLLVLGDHTCFDVWSLATWLRDILFAASLAFSAAWEGSEDEAYNLEPTPQPPVLNWSSHLPFSPGTLAPLASPLGCGDDIEILVLRASTGVEKNGGADDNEEENEFMDAVDSHEDDADDVIVSTLNEDVVVILDKRVFTNLKAECAANECSDAMSFNGPLLAAFGAAVIDACRLQAAEERQLQNSDVDDIQVHDPGLMLGICGLCAVDVRAELKPPLPSDTMGSISGFVPCGVELEPVGANLWEAATKTQGALMDAISAAEPLRLADLRRTEAVTSGPDGAEKAIYSNANFIWTNLGHVNLLPANTLRDTHDESRGAEEVEVLEAVDGEFDLSGAEDSTVVPPDPEGMKHKLSSRFGKEVVAIETHWLGAPSNIPIELLSAQCMEVGDRLALTITYSPTVHQERIITYIAQRFQCHVEALARGPGIYKYVDPPHGPLKPQWPDDPLGAVSLAAHHAALQAAEAKATEEAEASAAAAAED